MLHMITDNFDYVYIVACGLLFFIGFFGNLLIITIVAINKDLRTPMNLFLMNLAIGDFFAILLCLPVTAIENIAQVWYGGVFTCKLVKFLQNASVLGSVMWLTALSVERRRMITRSTASLSVIERAVATKRCYVTCALIWFTAFVLAFPMPLILEIRQTRCDYIAHLSLVAKVYEYFLFGIMICLPVVVIAIMQCNVAAVLLRHSNPAIIVNSEESGSYANSLQTGAHSQLTNQLTKFQFYEQQPNQTNQGLASNMYGDRDHMREVRHSSLNSQVVTPGQHLSIQAWKRTANILIFLVFLLAFSYLPLCIVTFICTLMEGDQKLENDYANTSSIIILGLAPSDNSSDFSDEQESDISWKSFFLFAHFIFYVCPAFNPLVFYILSRRMRMVIKDYCKTLISKCNICKYCASTRYQRNGDARNGIYHHYELDTFLEAVRTHVAAGTHTNRRTFRNWFTRQRDIAEPHDVTLRYVFMLDNRERY